MRASQLRKSGLARDPRLVTVELVAQSTSWGNPRLVAFVVDGVTGDDRPSWSEIFVSRQLQAVLRDALNVFFAWIILWKPYYTKTYCCKKVEGMVVRGQERKGTFRSGCLPDIVIHFGRTELITISDWFQTP
jgi:hypothetical protein